MFPNMEIPSKDDLNPNKAVKKLPASYSLINLDFKLPQTLKFDESILLLFFSFQLLTSYFLYLSTLHTIR